MKLFTKKTLAILLSALIVMGTVSMLSFADTIGNLTPATVFYNADGSTADEIYAQKGEIVKATIKLTTDFPAGQMALLFRFNSNMFTFATEKYTSLGNGKYTLITEDTQTGGYIYQVASGSGEGGYNPSGITLGEGKGGVYISTNKYTVKKYNDSPEFTVYLKVKDSDTLAYTEEGTMETLEDFCASNSSPNKPNNVILFDDDNIIGETESSLTDEMLDDHAWSSVQYTLKILPGGVSASNKVVLKGSVFFDPKGTVGADTVNGTIEGSTDAVEKNGFYGDNVSATDIPASVVAPAGYTFKGWSTDGSTVLTEAQITAKQFGGDGATIAPTTFKAVYDLADIEITYTLGDGKTAGAKWTDTNSNADKTATHKKGDSLTDEKTANGNLASWDGYKFDGWDPSTPDTVGTEALTFNAKWDGPYYKVTYYKADGTTVYQGPTEVKAGESIGTVPENDGDSHFSRWVDMSDSTKSPADYTAMPSSDLNFKAVYKYTVTWDYNGAPGLTDPTTGEEGTAYTTPSPSWGAHQFNGWVADDGSGAPTGAIPGKDITYTAQWDNFKLTVDLDGGTLATAPNNWILEDGKYVAEYEDSATVNAPADPTKEGYTFAGW
ncbi:MAG: InlB B-repeat-containing protein, partial [Clostridia bacterium]|nr:InlB B-repeat-containing protein [Clostridia bacterium]